MRVLSHPNVVDLRAFFYTSGEKVCNILLTIRKMKCILTWSVSYTHLTLPTIYSV